MESKEQNPVVNHLAHDLNNILTRILNSVELLKKKIPKSDSIDPLLASIENGTYLASEIIEDVVAESSQKILRKRRVNINTLINDLVATLSVLLNHRIIFEVKLDPDLPFVEGRYTDYYRVIMNLIINASEAIKDNGSISISTKHLNIKSNEKSEPALFETGNIVMIKIADTGSGIDKSVMPYIFDEQFSTKSKRKNSGIGLTIVKKIVEANNGFIKVASEKNKGTEFSIRFPAVVLGKNKSTNSNKVILIAEDEEIQRQLLQELLESYNYKVITAANGHEVLEKLLISSPDLLIIDRQMPMMDGATCIRRIKELNYDTPIILASGSDTNKIDTEYLDKLVNKTINKPYNFEEMLGIIRLLVS